MRLRETNGRWIAPADTPDGPSLGLGKGAILFMPGSLGELALVTTEIIRAEFQVVQPDLNLS